MKRIFVIVICMAMLFGNIIVNADEAEMGPFGGITEGKDLPTMMEYNFTTNTTSTTKAVDYSKYKEMIFISGKPVEVEGTMKLTKGDSKVRTSKQGSYTEKYIIKAQSQDGSVVLDRSIEIDVTFENDGKVIYRNGLVNDSKNWKETITIDGTAYVLNSNLTESSFSKNSTEHIKPGVSYYQTTTTYRAVYYNGNSKISVEGLGYIYGYKQPWSKVETQRLTLQINNQVGQTPWQMTVIVKPTMTAQKSIHFQKASPGAISFDGKYNQTLERESTLQYEILTTHPNLDQRLLEGASSIRPASQLETVKLIPDGLDFLSGHWAEGDVRQLYSLGVMTETPSRNMMYQLTTRGEFVKQLCLALRINVDQYDDPKGKEPQIFRDVPYTNPYYKYVMAAYKTGISVGVGAENKFGVDSPITRQEAFALLVRTIGLERLGVGVNPRTPFKDDKDISDWARKEIAAAYQLGIVSGNDSNMVLPGNNISKLETASIVNRMIKYLRSEISSDYINME